MEEQTCLTNSYIFQQGQIDDPALYLIIKGSIDVLVATDKNQSAGFKIYQVNSGQTLNEINFLTGEQYSFSAKCTTFVQLCKIERKKFFEILQQNEEDFEKFHMIKDQFIFEQNSKHYLRECKMCSRGTHTESKCNRLTYCPNYYNLNMKRNHKEKSQIRNESFLRTSKKRIKSLDNDLFMYFEFIIEKLYEDEYFQNYAKIFVSESEFSDSELESMNEKSQSDNLEQSEIQNEHFQYMEPQQLNKMHSKTYQKQQFSSISQKQNNKSMKIYNLKNSNDAENITIKLSNQTDQLKSSNEIQLEPKRNSVNNLSVIDYISNENFLQQFESSNNVYEERNGEQLQKIPSILARSQNYFYIKNLKPQQPSEDCEYVKKAQIDIRNEIKDNKCEIQTPQTNIIKIKDESPKGTQQIPNSLLFCNKNDKQAQLRQTNSNLQMGLVKFEDEDIKQLLTRVQSQNNMDTLCGVQRPIESNSYIYNSQQSQVSNEHKHLHRTKSQARQSLKHQSTVANNSRNLRGQQLSKQFCKALTNTKTCNFGKLQSTVSNRSRKSQEFCAPSDIKRRERNCANPVLDNLYEQIDMCGGFQNYFDLFEEKQKTKFFIEFDGFRDWKIYFPQFNLSNLVRKYKNQFRKKKENKDKDKQSKSKRQTSIFKQQQNNNSISGQQK